MREKKDISRRDYQIHIRVSLAERDEIKARAQAKGRPVGNYLRAAALGMLGK
ncbi:MAG: hypothetical protein LBG46_00700 [Elusimicrobiota bacterium]|jgi:predicted DNA binding CopG/RHH family protein|nr:hypothetical protein [Elusimicrobiota bacterium]